MKKEEMIEVIDSVKQDNIISSKEANILLELVKDSSDDISDVVEDYLIESIVDTQQLKDEIAAITTMIVMNSNSASPAGLKRDIESIIRIANFRILTIEKVEIREIFRSKSSIMRQLYHQTQDEDRRAIIGRVSHAIVKVSYDGHEYGFSYNPSSNSVSYKVDDMAIRYFKVDVDIARDFDRLLQEVEDIIAHIIEVEWWYHA